MDFVGGELANHRIWQKEWRTNSCQNISQKITRDGGQELFNKVYQYCKLFSCYQAMAFDSLTFVVFWITFSVCAQFFYSFWKKKINICVFCDLFTFFSSDFALSFSDTLI